MVGYFGYAIEIPITDIFSIQSTFYSKHGLKLMQKAVDDTLVVTLQNFIALREDSPMYNQTVAMTFKD